MRPEPPRSPARTRGDPRHSRRPARDPRTNSTGQRPPRDVLRALVPGLGCAYLLLFLGVDEGFIGLGPLARYATPKGPTNVIEIPIVFALSVLAATSFSRRWRRGQLRERSAQIRYVLLSYLAALVLYLQMPTLPF